MGSSKYKPSRMLILLTAMAVLLPLLAALQYYWLGQVSEGASERLQSSLRANAVAFRHDFNRELIRAYLNFHMDSLTPAAGARSTEIARFNAERLQQWNQTAPYPRLISDVLVVNYDEQDRAVLSRLDAKAGRFEMIDWSGDLAKLRQRFDRRDENSSSIDPMSVQTPLESFAEDIPALIVPFPPLPTDQPQSQAGSQAGPGGNVQLLVRPSGFTIIKLDLNYMQHEFIPALIKRHFFDNSKSEYNLAIVSLNPPQRVIYPSSYPATDFASSDVSTRIFGFEADELRSFLSNESAPPAGGQPGARSVRLINLRFLKRAGNSANPDANEEDGSWQLLIKHRAGSLTAAVTSARRRNLALSFGILLLLGAGILMTAIAMRRAERLARQQIDFVAGVTHELRTPLAVICSAGENLADGIVDAPEKVAQYGEVIYREGRRLTDMVEQVLEFAGAQSGRQRYEFRATDVRDFIAGAIAACETQIQERDFQIEELIEPNLPPVHGNSAALRRAMQNLISNAIKYDGANRWARIAAHTAVGERGNEMQISIEDRGLGIESTDLSHIFEPFYRGREAVAAQIEGSGVGLSLVRQIVEAHGGKVTVKSTPGSGTVFTLHLPIAVPAEMTGGVTEGDKS
jgi:signal transduction histidine kinase